MRGVPYELQSAISFRERTLGIEEQLREEEEEDDECSCLERAEGIEASEPECGVVSQGESS